jgi:hypothetical protein
MIDMRMLMIVLTAVAPLMVSGWAEAKDRGGKDPGLGFIQHKNSKVTKDYYVVKAGSGKCSIVTGSFGKKPEGVVGDAPYASKGYAKTALESSPECKGGLADE